MREAARYARVRPPEQGLRPRAGAHQTSARRAGSGRPLRRMQSRQAPAGSILIFDGIFALRNELVDFWDYAVWLEVPFDVSMARVAQRDGADPNPHSGANRRYVDGQLIYINECAPRGRATVVVENTILAHPVLHRVRANARVKAS